MQPLRGVPSRPVQVKQNRRRLRAVLAQLAALKMEGLSIYRALPEGERFHASTAKIRIGEGSNAAPRRRPGLPSLPARRAVATHTTNIRPVAALPW